MSTPITIIGNITRDPELRYTDNNKAVLNLTVAVNHSKPDGNGGFTNLAPSFYDFTLWEKQAENAVESLVKGTRVAVSGSLRLQDWQQGDRKGINVVVERAECFTSIRWATAEVTKNPKGAKTNTESSESNASTDQEEAF